MSENVVFLIIFDTCDVMFNWSISLLLPIVLDNLNLTLMNNLQKKKLQIYVDVHQIKINLV